MSAPINMHQRNTVTRLWVFGKNKSEITRIVGLTWPSVHKIIREWQSGPGKGTRRVGPQGFWSNEEDDALEREYEAKSRAKSNGKGVYDPLLDEYEMEESYIEDELGDHQLGNLEDDESAYG